MNNAKQMIKIIDIEVTTGKTIIHTAIDAHQSFLPLTDLEIKENNEAVNLLLSEMGKIGAMMVKSKEFHIQNDWVDVNDDIVDVLEMDFSDTFPKKEKQRIEKLLSEYIK